MKPSTRASIGAAHTWGPYWDILFPPQSVTGWINWKRMSTGVNVAKDYGTSANTSVALTNRFTATIRRRGRPSIQASC